MKIAFNAETNKWYEESWDNENQNQENIERKDKISLWGLWRNSEYWWITWMWNQMEIVSLSVPTLKINVYFLPILTGPNSE